MSTLHLRKIRSLVAEQAAGQNTLIMGFGRFQPPTVGHALLINAVRHTAEKHHAHAAVFVSTSQDSTKNPLTAQEKVHYLSKMFPGLTFAPDPSEGNVRGIIGIFKYISDNGFKGHKINHIILVAGSDRVPEFKAKLSAYNGKSYNFQSIDVVSAGERDPDDEGVAGMSGTKMRAAAKDMDFKKFRSGIPPSLSDKDTRDLMQKIRASMSVNESFHALDEMVLQEGVHDQAIFKAVFLIGGTGSGKDFILKKVLSGHGFVESNPDTALEYFMDKENLSKKMPEHEAEKRYVVRQKATTLTKKRRQLFLDGRQGIIINGTGDKPSRYVELKHDLENLGYECKMIFVSTTDEVSKKRNIERGELGGRTVPEHVRAVKWRETMLAKDYLKGVFGPENFIEFDNSADLRTAPESVKREKTAELMDIFKKMRKFAEKTPSSPIAREWMKAERRRNAQTNEDFENQFHTGSVDDLFETFFNAGAASLPVINALEKRHEKKKKTKKHHIGAALIPVIMKRKKHFVIKDEDR